MDPHAHIIGWLYDRADRIEGMLDFMVSEKDCCNEQYQLHETSHHVSVRSWWLSFMAKYTDALAKIPSHDKVPLSQILCQIASETGKCPKCGPVALGQLSEFATTLTLNISSVLDNRILLPVD
ncbi:hypothetical protein QCA50_009079 [Cerrena zonata]|uniref:Uncharacterized protein n=1 Tax=Cerrena zonata TaxID=2478898 RepID=A0AAW0G9P6_9APHY